jgi:hypothetical protein
MDAANARALLNSYSQKAKALGLEVPSLEYGESCQAGFSATVSIPEVELSSIGTAIFEQHTLIVPTDALLLTVWI